MRVGFAIRDSAVRKALSSDLHSKLKSGDAHWVTVKEGPLKGRHLLINGPRPAGGRQSRGKILAGHGIPAHVVEKLTGATHAHEVKHEVSDGPKDDLSAKRKERDEKHARHTKALDYRLSDTKRRLAQLESYGETLNAFNKVHVNSIRAALKTGDAIMSGEKDPTDDELNSVMNTLDGAGPALQSMIEGAERRKWKTVESKTPKSSEKQQVSGPFTERDAERHNATTHYPMTAQEMNSGHHKQMESLKEKVMNRLKQQGILEMPEDVAEAVSRVESAYIHQSRESIRAREVAPPWSVTGRGNYKGQPDKARGIEERAGQKTDAAVEYLDRLVNRRASSRISSDSPDAISKLEGKIEQAEARQAAMKQANSIIRKKNITDAEKIKQVMALGIPADEAKEAVIPNPNWDTVPGFRAFELQNNNANIKRMKERVEELKRKQSNVAPEQPFNGGAIRDNADDNRVQIFFDDKPEAEVRNKLKARGFKWAPSIGAWQRMRSADALRIAREIVGAEKVTKSMRTTHEWSQVKRDKRDEYGTETYADPDHDSYPLTKDGKPSRERTMAAWRYIHVAHDEDEYTPAERERIKSRIRSFARRHFDVELSDQTKKSLRVVFRLAK